MSTTSVSEVLATANATMVGANLDVTGALAHLVTGSVDALGARAAAVLVESEGVLEVLVATSHRAHDLEIHQVQADEGPCLDALRSGEEVSLHGEAALVARWPVAGPIIVRSGYLAVQATPLRWHGDAFGALNVFGRDEGDLLDVTADCRALADAVTMIIVSGRLADAQLGESLRFALADRAVVEQAKGAIAHVASLDMAAAFDALGDLAAAERLSLGVAAARVMERARAGTLREHLAQR